MKKISIIIIGVLITFSASAQKYALQSAKNYLKDGELKLAKQYIDQATAEGTNTYDMAETWVYKGLIYCSVYEDTTKRSLDANALEEAYGFFQKAVMLDTKKEFTELIKSGLGELKIDMYDKGILILQKNENDVAHAYPCFTKAMAISNYINTTFQTKDIDTLSMYNTALTAMYVGKLDTAKMIYQQLAAYTYNSSARYKSMPHNIYIDYASVEEKLKDTASAQAILKKGEQVLPNDEQILVADLNISLQQKRYSDAVSGLKSAIQLEPTNAEFYYFLGLAYEKSKDFDNAEASYRKAVQIKPDYTQAQYSIGAMFYNEGADLTREMAKMGTTAAEQTKYDQLKKQSDDFFAKAEPELLKAYAINPKDEDTLNGLIALYTHMNKMDKVTQYQAELDAAKKAQK